MLDKQWRVQINRYIRSQKDRDQRLEDLRKLVPRELELPRPGEIRAWLEGIQKALWDPNR